MDSTPHVPNAPPRGFSAAIVYWVVTLVAFIAAVAVFLWIAQTARLHGVWLPTG